MENDNPIINPLKGRAGVAVIVVFVALSLVIIGIAASGFEKIGWTESAVMRVFQSYCLVILLGWFCFVVCESFTEFLITISCFAVASSPFVFMTLKIHPIFAWISLIAINMFALFSFHFLNSRSLRQEMLSEIEMRRAAFERKCKHWDNAHISYKGADKEDRLKAEISSRNISKAKFCSEIEKIERRGFFSESNWSTFATSAIIVWIMSGHFISIGNSGYLDYAKPVIAVSEIHVLLDLRLFISTLIGIVFFARAVISAYDRGMPKVPHIPLFAIPRATSKQGSLWKAISQPIISVVNWILHVCVKAADFFWQMGSVTLSFMGRIGKLFLVDLYRAIFKSEIWLSMFRVTATFLALVVAINIAVFISPLLYEYLGRDTSFSAISSDLGISSLVFCLSFSVGAMLILFLNWIWKIVQQPRDRIIQAATTLIVGWFLAASIALILCKLKILDWPGYQSIGAFTFFFGIPLVVIPVVQIIRTALIARSE